MKLAGGCAYLLIAACTSAPTPEADLNSLNARVTTTCRAIMENRDLSATVDCLNTALATNTVALASGDYWESNSSECIEHWFFFAVDGEVRVFERIDSCLYTSEPTFTEQTCPGPFSTATSGTFQIQATGCTFEVGG